MSLSSKNLLNTYSAAMPKLILIIIIFLLSISTFVAEANQESIIKQNEPSSANESSAWEQWQLTLVKSLTYRLVASVDDILAVYYLTNNWLNTTAIMANVILSKSIVYAGHESAWSYFAPHPDNQSVSEHAEYALKKSITYRISAMINTFVMAMLFTGSTQTSTVLVGMDSIYGTGIYFFHEMLWEEFGPANYKHPR